MATKRGYIVLFSDKFTPGGTLTPDLNLGFHRGHPMLQLAWH
jgi:hypothetical protein